MIISAYPGVGKSTYCKTHKNCIDFESSNFSKTNSNWVEDYCKNAINLHDQGFTVFVSSHQAVQEYLRKYFYYTANKYDYWMLMFAPNIETEVLDRLFKRALETRLTKDTRALAHAIEAFSQDCSAVQYQQEHGTYYDFYESSCEKEHLNVYWINSLDYNLEIILKDLKTRRTKFEKEKKEESNND